MSALLVARTSQVICLGYPHVRQQCHIRQATLLARAHAAPFCLRPFLFLPFSFTSQVAAT